MAQLEISIPLQRKIISCLLRSPQSLAEAIGVLDRNCFTRYKPLFVTLAFYYQKYKTIPNIDAIKEIAAEKGLIIEELYRKAKQTEVDVNDFPLLMDKLKKQGAGQRIVNLIDKSLEILEGQGAYQAYSFLEKGILKHKEKSLDETEIVDYGKTSPKRYGDYKEVELNPELAKGMLSGLAKIDEVTNGFQKGEYVIIMGAPEAGKSTWLINQAYQSWWKDGKNILVATLEMPEKQVSRRLDARVADIDYKRLKDGKLSLEEKKKYLTVLKEMKSKPGMLKVVDIPRNCTSLYIESQIAKFDVKFDIVLIDHQMLMCSVASKKDTDWLEQSEIARELKQIARAYETVVISAMPIRRLPASRQKLTLSDIARAYQIAYHADAIFGVVKTGDHELYIESSKMRDNPSVRFRAYADFSRMLITNSSDTLSVDQLDWGNVGE